MLLKISIGLFGLLLTCSAQADECWRTHKAQVHEWTCAGKSLPEDSQAFALSILVVDSPKSILVVDSGATASVGEQAALAIQGRFGNKPIWILNSQPKPEHVLGNVGFRKVFGKNLPAGEPFTSRIVAGKLTAELMQARCPKCIENFSERMGSASVAGTESLVPGRVLKAESGNLGVLQAEFKSWKYRLYKNMETEEALVLRNNDLKLWWVGSAVQGREIPDLYDGNIIERIEFLSKLKSTRKPDDTVLTSFGPVPVELIESNLNYFVRVQQEVLYGLENGVSEVELIQHISKQISEFQPIGIEKQDLKLNAKALETHQLNIQRIFRQTEPFAF